MLDLDATATIHASKKVGSSMATTTAIATDIFCGRFLLGAKLRPANIDGAAGAVDEVARIVARIRARWPKVRIIRSLCAYLFGLCPISPLRRAVVPKGVIAYRAAGQHLPRRSVSW